MQTQLRNSIVAIVSVALVALLCILYLIPRMVEPSTYRGDACQQDLQALRAIQSLHTGAREGTQEKTVRDAQLNTLLWDAQGHGCQTELESKGYSFADLAPLIDLDAPMGPTAPSATPAPSASADGTDKWSPTYYALQRGKVSDLSYGPPVRAKDAKDAVNQFWVRHTNDPALLCGNGGQWVNDNGDGVDCTRTLAASKVARDAYLDIAKSHVKSVEWIDLKPHHAYTAFMMPVKGLPVVLWQSNPVYRQNTEKYFKVTTTDGRVLYYRAECGIQPDKMVSKPAKATSNPESSRAPHAALPSPEAPGESPRETAQPPQRPTSTPVPVRPVTPRESQTPKPERPTDKPRKPEAPRETPTKRPTPTPETPRETPTEKPTPKESTVPKDPSKFKTHPAHTPAPAPTQEPGEPKLPPCANGGERDNNQRCSSSPREDTPEPKPTKAEQAPGSTPTPTRDKPVPTSTDAPKPREDGGQPGKPIATPED